MKTNVERQFEQVIQSMSAQERQELINTLERLLPDSQKSQIDVPQEVVVHVRKPHTHSPQGL